MSAHNLSDNQAYRLRIIGQIVINKRLLANGVIHALTVYLLSPVYALTVYLLRINGIPAALKAICSKGLQSPHIVTYSYLPSS